MKRENFNTGWKVWKDENPFELVAAVPPHAKPVTLPYDAMFHEEQQEDSVNKGSTGFLDGGAYKYHKTFFVPEDWRGGKVMLWFEGVYRHAAVFVNQSLAGERAFGYSEFGVEIQDYLRFGQENQVLVTVKCGTQNSRWYSGAGIYREVYLLHSPALRVLPGSLRLTTLSVEEGGAAVEIAAEIENGDVTPHSFTAAVTIREGTGRAVLQAEYPLRVRPGQKVRLHRRFFLENACLWDAEHPELYTAELAIEGGDRDKITTGIRLLALDAKHGLRVNGMPVKLRGACLHHDQGLLGAAAYEDFEHSWEQDVESMVTADYNHPSAVLYSTGNEIFEIATEKGLETSRMLGEKFHELDPTRFTTNGINGAFAAGDGLAQIVRDITGQEPGPGDVNVFMGAMANHMPEITRHKIVGDILEKLEPTMEVLGYNYMTARYRTDAARYPHRVMVGSETYPKQIAENWDAITRTSAVLGDFTWTGWDYLGEVGINLTGSAELLAFGSERARHHQGYEKTAATLTDGCALAVLRRTGQGEVTVEIGCGGVKSMWKS